MIVKIFALRPGGNLPLLPGFAVGTPLFFFIAFQNSEISVYDWHLFTRDNYFFIYIEEIAMAKSCKSCSSEQQASCGPEQKSSCGSANAAIAQQEIAITRSLTKIKNKILVMSGKGGVGKSTVAVNLALGLAQRGYRVGLMDVDLHGPDICRMLNLTGSLQPPKNPGDLVPTLQYNANLKVVSLEYMMKNRDDAIIWRGPLKIQAIRQFVADMDWG